MDGTRFKQIEHLTPGCRVRVIQKFFDANGDVHPVGEEFLYESVTVHGPKLIPTLHGPGTKIPLNGEEPRQGRLREYFEIVTDSKASAAPPPEARPRRMTVPPPMPARPEKIDWDLYQVAIVRACALADNGDREAANACLKELENWPFPIECPVDSQIGYDMSQCEMLTGDGLEWRDARIRDYYGSFVASSTSGGEAAARSYHVTQLLSKKR